MNPPARTILLTTAVALAGAAGPASAAVTGQADRERALSRAEVIAASIQPGFSEPAVRATRQGLTVEVHNTGVTTLNVRVAASEFAAQRVFGYRPTFKRLAPGTTAKVELTAPKQLVRLIERRKRLRRVAVVTVANAESNAQRTVEKRFR